MERLAEFEIFERDAARDRLTAEPIGIAGVEGAGEIPRDLGGGFPPILGDFATAIIPEMRPAERLSHGRIGFVVRD